MIVVNAKRDARWLTRTLDAVREAGCAVVEAVLDRSFTEATRVAMVRAHSAMIREVGRERLQRAGEVGVLRLMLKYDPQFFEFLTIPELLAVVDGTVSETAILHLQNGFILPSSPRGQSPSVFQTRFHMDFPRVLNGFLASINVLFAIDDFRRDNGATVVVPGTQQRPVAVAHEYLQAHAVPIECSAGSMIVFDSTLWHAAGPNYSGRERFAINHQFTRSYFKQQIDYVRALGDDVVLAQKSRTQQLLGWYTRVPSTLLEYYRSEEDRLYRKGQG